MALWSQVKDLLNKFADTQTALRLPGKDLSNSNPMIGDAIEALVNEVAAGDAGEAQAYDPATPEDWGETPPTTVSGALDALAAAVAALQNP